MKAVNYRRATTTAHEYRAGDSIALSLKCGEHRGGQFIEVSFNFDLAAPSARLASGNRGGLIRHQTNDRLTRFGDNNILARYRTLNKPGQVRFGFMNIGNLHD